MSLPNKFSRRGFLTTAATAAVGSHLVSSASAAAAPRRKLREFSYSQVTLTGGPMAAQYQRMHKHFLTLDNDRILKVYRQRAGLPAPGADMGGWYDADGFVPGHLIGQFISGLSRIAANTGDKAAAAKAQALVVGYAATFGADNNPYASPKGSTTWPCYILDKYEIGLIDAAMLIGSEEAKKLLPRVLTGAIPFIPDHTYDRTPDSPKQAPYDEPYILSENFFRSHELTGDPRFREMAQRYLLNKEFFDPLSENRNIFPGKHGYSHVIALSSGAKAYEVLGDEKYLRAVQNAWKMLVETQQYASGAWAPKEVMVEPHKGQLGASLTTTRDHFETPCGYYAHSKLARYLLGFTGEAQYGDGLENVLLNTILGSIDPDDDGGYFYYSDYQNRAKKGYYQRKWPCCAGTLVQSVADYPLNIYFEGDRSVYVNLFADSELRWKVNNVPVQLRQKTQYPESGVIDLTLQPESPVEFSLAVRIPGWLDSSAQLTVNGKPANVPVKRGTFATIRRRWQKNDTVRLTLPFGFRTVPVDDQHPTTVAVMHGPVLLNAIDPPAELKATSAALQKMDPVSGKPLEFECRTPQGKLRMKPFYQITGETYGTYFEQVTGA